MNGPEAFFHIMFRSVLGMGVPRSLTQEHDWRYSAEKSAAAQRRENEAKNKFNYLNNQMNLALYENTMTTIGLACHAKSDSPLKLLPPDVMNSVLAFVGCTKPGLMPGVKASLDRRTNNNAIVPFAGLGTPESQLNLGDVSLFRPGSKLVIPFSKPNLHLTNACWRDLKKHVKTHDSWDLKRVAATEAQKKEYRETRKGTVYFVNAVYSVPGKKSAGKRKCASDGAGAASGKKKATKAARAEPLSPDAQARATSALVAALQSAAADPNGNVDPDAFGRALGAGYSKSFILVKAADHAKLMKNAKLVDTEDNED